LITLCRFPIKPIEEDNLRWLCSQQTAISLAAPESFRLQVLMTAVETLASQNILSESNVMKPLLTVWATLFDVWKAQESKKDQEEQEKESYYLTK